VLIAFIKSMPWLTPAVILAVGALLGYQAKRHLTFSVISLQLFLVFVGCWGAYRLELRQNEQAEAQSAIKHERVIRSKVQSEINRYVCTENNKQDGILAGLVRVSLGGQTAFGAGIDRSTLSPFDEEVVGSINKVQKLGETEGAAAYQAAFREALEQLEAETPCKALVTAFLVASTTDDLRAVKHILRTASKADGDKPKHGKSPKSQRPPKP
jgi:hypothetical protein